MLFYAHVADNILPDLINVYCTDLSDTNNSTHSCWILVDDLGKLIVYCLWIKNVQSMWEFDNFESKRTLTFKHDKYWYRKHVSWSMHIDLKRNSPLDQASCIVLVCYFCLACQYARQMVAMEWIFSSSLFELCNFSIWMAGLGYGQSRLPRTIAETSINMGRCNSKSGKMFSS